MSRKSSDGGWRRRYATILIAADLVAIMSGALVASLVRFGGLSNRLAAGNGPSYLVLTMIGALGWLLTLGASGAYNKKSIGLGPEEYRRVCEGAIRFLAVVALAVFVTKLNLARSYVAVAVPVATILAIALRHSMRLWLYRQQLHGRFTRGVLVVGSEGSVTSLTSHFRQSDLAEFVVLGVCTPSRSDRRPRTHLEIDGAVIPIVGEPAHAWDATVRTGADIIALADAESLPDGGLRRLARQIEGSQVDLMAVPSLTDIAGPRITVCQVAGLPLLYVGKPELNGRRRITKAGFERLVALTALMATAPLLLAIGLLVRLTSRGPAMFRQERVGLNGKRFVMWKFRTMVVNADAQLAEVLHLNEMNKVLFKVRQDPRVTPVGRVLRRWSLDELPQLWNVLRGDMSLVGPRPPLPSEVEKYADETYRRLLVKPGITGLWQVSGRSALSWEESIQLDLHYVDNWSLALDLILLVKTLKAVVLRKGAW